jgi:hypothetical protein
MGRAECDRRRGVVKVDGCMATRKTGKGETMEGAASGGVDNDDSDDADDDGSDDDDDDEE